MLFIILNAITGLALVALPVVLARKFRHEWKMPKWMFLKVGLLAMVIQVFAFSVFDSLIGYIAGFDAMDIVWQALLTGVFAGLFFELGRFYILDKIFYKVRDFKSSVYFGFGWSGVAMFMVGAALLFSSIGLYILSNTADVSSLMPDATSEQIEQLQMLKDMTNGGVIESLYAVAPIFEAVAFLILDVLLTLIVVLGLNNKQISNVWIAVAIRALVTTLKAIAITQSTLIALLLFIAIGIASYLKAVKLKPAFST